MIIHEEEMLLAVGIRKVLHDAFGDEAPYHRALSEGFGAVDRMEHQIFKGQLRLGILNSPHPAEF